MTGTVLQRLARAQGDMAAILALTVVSTATNVLPRDLCSPVLVALALCITPHYPITRRFMRAMWPLAALLAVGLTGLLAHDFRDIARDIFFALTPLALVYIGHWLAQRERFWPSLPVVVVWLGVVFAMQHLSAFAVKPSLLLEESMVVRAATGNVADITVLAFVVLVFIDKLTGGCKPLKGVAYHFALGILTASVVLSYSRTAVVVVVICAVAAKGWLNRRNLKWPALMVVAMLGILLVLSGESVEGEELTFMSKMARSLEEVAISNYETLADISLNWRGFETFKALEQYASGSNLQLVIGQGFGALVDLGFYMPLGGDASIDFCYIPVTHNGYAYVLLKYGVLGIVLYLTFYIKLIRMGVAHQQSADPLTQFCARLLLGLTLALMFVMFVGGGMAELVDSEFVVMTGVLLNRIARRNRRLPQLPSLPQRKA